MLGGRVQRGWEVQCGFVELVELAGLASEVDFVAELAGSVVVLGYVELADWVVEVGFVAELAGLVGEVDSAVVEEDGQRV